MTDQDHELELTREPSFFDKSRAVRSLLVAMLAVCVFAFLHFREVRVEMLELGTKAERYVVAQVDVEFFDEEATILLKNEAVRDIGKIYAIKEEEIRSTTRFDFEKYLNMESDWRERSESTTFEEIYQSVVNLEALLIATRFTDPRTLNKLKSIKMPTDSYHVFSPRDISGKLPLPPQVWTAIRRSAFADKEMSVDTVDFIMAFFELREWTLEEDANTQRALQKRVKSRVPDQYTKIGAGSRVIDQGEKVANRHLAMLQAMKKALTEQRNLWHPVTLMGSFLMTALLLGIAYAYFRSYHREVLSSNRKFFLVISVVTLTLIFAKLTENVLLKAPISLVDVVRFPLFVPLAAILICGLLNPSIAFVTSTFLTIILTLALAVERSEFMMVNLLTSFVAILSMRTLRQRKEIFTVCAKAFFAAFGVVLASHFYTGTLYSVSAAMDVFSVFLFMVFTAICVLGLLPFFESVFHVITDVTLMEYMDPNQEILRRLSIEAPGTYQHSMVVGTLSEAAALAIGANGLFCRASTLYHDIGKLATPHYFTENQQGGMNMHQLLTPLESAQVIIAHVSEGVSLARKIGLPEQFIDIIKEHHGTTLVYYFYRQQLEKVGGDKAEINEREFRYAGPKPRSKESAIIMIADSFEAASRSLDEANHETLTELIDRLVATKAQDGQLDNCLLTFEELGIVKKAMVNTLVAAGHSRIKYPKPEGQEPSEQPPMGGMKPKEVPQSAALDESG